MIMIRCSVTEYVRPHILNNNGVDRVEAECGLRKELTLCIRWVSYDICRWFSSFRIVHE